jgi:cytochrome c5
MTKNILIVTLLSLIVVACGKSDEEAADETNTSKDALDVQSTTVTETPTMESVTAPEPDAQASGQTEIAASGEAVYKRACVGCHMSGAAGAPRLGDVPAWESRIAKGSAALVQSAINGVPGTAMMARGTCGTCSDDDIKAAVEYMIAQSR